MNLIFIQLSPIPLHIPSIVHLPSGQLLHNLSHLVPHDLSSGHEIQSPSLLHSSQFVSQIFSHFSP